MGLRFAICAANSRMSMPDIESVSESLSVIYFGARFRREMRWRSLLLRRHFARRALISRAHLTNGKWICHRATPHDAKWENSIRNRSNAARFMALHENGLSSDARLQQNLRNWFTAAEVATTFRSFIFAWPKFHHKKWCTANWFLIFRVDAGVLLCQTSRKTVHQLRKTHMQSVVVLTSTILIDDFRFVLRKVKTKPGLYRPRPSSEATFRIIAQMINVELLQKNKTRN